MTKTPYAHTRAGVFDRSPWHAVKAADIAQRHLQQCQAVLRQMAAVDISLEDAGLRLSATVGPNVIIWEPDDGYSQQFSQLPVPFAQSYLQRRLRDFLNETFCQPVVEAKAEAQVLPGNDRIGGNMHVGLLQQFELANQGRGYFHPGWQVVFEEKTERETEETPEEATKILAVQNYGVVLHIDRERHLRVEEQQAKIGDVVAVWMPCYRFESGAIIAVGEAGFVPEERQAMDFYLAVEDDQMAAVLRQVTTALNGLSGDKNAVPFTLKAPYRPEDYGKAESMVLRVAAADCERALAVMRSLEKFCCKNTPWPMFACPVYPGVSMAAAIDSRASFWYGSSADLSRTERVAAGLMKVWYEHGQQRPSLARRSQAIASQLRSAGLDPAMPAWLAAKETLSG